MRTGAEYLQIRDISRHYYAKEDVARMTLLIDMHLYRRPLMRAQEKGGRFTRPLAELFGLQTKQLGFPESHLVWHSCIDLDPCN